MEEKKSLFLDTLRHVYGPRPAVWFMRQAGRVLPRYQVLSRQYGFAHLMAEPELAAQVTLLPVEDLGVDAAILFSDILVIPMALGVQVEWTPQGPTFPNPLLQYEDPCAVLQRQENKLEYIYQVIDKIIRKRCPGTPLIGFCGGPLTIMLYMLQGMSRKGSYNDAVTYIYTHRRQVELLLETITEMTVVYVRQQVAHGIDAFQLFESYAGEVSEDLYRELFLPAVKRIMAAVMEANIPTIYFGKGMGSGIRMLSPEVCTFASIDWQMPLDYARKVVDSAVGLQGNMDPRLLFAQREVIAETLQGYKPFFRKHSDWIFSLGHGLINGTPFENVKFVADWVKKESWL